MKKLVSLILAALMLAGVFAVAALAEESPFSDVKEKRWSYKAIKYAYDNGYMDGVGGGKFDPAGTMTRGMVVTVLYRMEGSPETEFRSDFSDVKDGKYYSGAVIWAKDNNIVNGVSEGKFDPGGKITREQLAAMLYRFSAYKNYNPMTVGDIEKFPDGEKAHSYAKDPLSWATGMGLITGVKSGDSDLLDPRGNATREQFATILMRFDNTYPVRYNSAVVQSHYTEKEYPLVTDADVYVATDGDDSAAGDFDHPVATFARAAELVRELKGSITGRSIVVAFKAGTYFTDSVTLTEEDSGTKEYPVVYCGYGDGEAIITGGAVIREEDFSPVGEDERYLFEEKAVDSIRKADISEKLPGYTTKDILFGEDGVKWVARFPDKYPDGTDNLFLYAGSTVSDHEIRINMPVMKRRVQNVYHTVEGLQLYGYLTTGWYKDILDTDGYSVDPETNDLDFWIPHPETARMGSLRYGEFPWQEYHASSFLNMSEDLNADGEYWVDRSTHTLYVYDPHGSYTFPAADRGIVMRDCTYVTFRGLTVTGYRKNLIKTNTCSGLTFELCRFSVCSGDIGIHLNDARAGCDLDLVFRECEFRVFAGMALTLDGPCGMRNRFSSRGNVLFDNNYVSYTNLVIDENAAVNFNNYNEAKVTHNEFVNCSRCAIRYSGCNMVAEYNTFDNIMFNSSDGGAIYAWNTQSDWNNVFRYNLFRETSKWFAFYVDDTETGTEIYGNLFFPGCTICIHNGRSTLVHDNIFIDSGVGLAMGDMLADIDKYNETGDIEIIKNNGWYKAWVNFFNAMDADPALKEEYYKLSDELPLLTVDLDRVNDPYFVLIPRNEIKNNWYIDDSDSDPNKEDKYSVFEGNVRFPVTENPCFVNPSAGDYRIVEGSGAPEVYFERMGRY